MATLLHEIEEKARVLDEAQAYSRRVVLFSKQAVMAMHRQDLQEAVSKLSEAEKILMELDKLLLDPSASYVKTAYQEYSEAMILLASIRGEEFPSPRDIGVPTIPYILGLADCIGELRRSALDALRRGEIGVAERRLLLMEEVYSELLPFLDFYPMFSELRRKMDVARHLIELTLGDVSWEQRRGSLERALKLLEKRIVVDKGEI
ncbi:MAG: haloacid dehalogenase [Candidatus Bathyarchaeia archaeon]